MIGLLGASTLLPANFSYQFAGFPDLGRNEVGGLALLFGYLLIVRPSQRNNRRMAWPEWIVGVQVLCVFFTVLTNQDVVQMGPFSRPGMSYYDSLGVIFRRMTMIGIPFLIGSRLIRSTEDAREVLKVIAAFGLLYLPLTLWEVRMSPQLHTQLYGYFPHSFFQQIRGNSYRPVVFTSHGLEAALFMATTMIATLGLAKSTTGRQQTRWLMLFFGLFGSLVLCRTLGALLLGMVGIGLLWAWRVQRTTLLALSCVVVLYPFLRTSGLFPTEELVSAAAVVSEDRAASLQYRFDNEDVLLEKAYERLSFGWGTWGRNLIYDVRSRQNASIVDGYWVLEIGQFGLLGFFSLFGLILTPMLLACRRLRGMSKCDQLVVITLCVLVITRALDLLPNSFPAPLTFFLAGTLIPFAMTKPAVARRPVRSPRRSVALQRAVPSG